MSRTYPSAILLLAGAIPLAACTDLSQRWELEQPRILAVRVSSQGLAAGAVADVDVLVFADDGAPAVVAPGLVRHEVEAQRALLEVRRDGEGWRLQAGDAAALASGRAAAGLAPDAPIPIGLVVAIDLAGTQLLARKTVSLGAAVANPASPVLAIGGVVPAAEVATVAVGRETELRMQGIDPTDPRLSFDWLTSTGELTRSETEAALLEVAADDPPSGVAVGLVRDEQAGGVAWSWIGLTTAP